MTDERGGPGMTDIETDLSPIGLNGLFTPFPPDFDIFSLSENPRFLCQWVLNISRQRPKKLLVFGRQPTFDNMLSQGPLSKRIYTLTIFQK